MAPPAPHRPPGSWLVDVLTSSLRLAMEHAGTLALLFAVGAGAAALVQRRREGASELVQELRAGALAVGLWLAVRELSVLDDAFYSFRYVDNWLSGQGLVFNPGERVEGYTNFLWVAVIALFAKLTPLRPHWIATVLSLLSFAANVTVIDRIGRRLQGNRGPHLPLAAWSMALCTAFTVFATTGLETMFASLLVNLGLLQLVEPTSDERSDLRRATTGSALFLLAAMARPDHGLFWVFGLLAVLAAGGASRRLAAAWLAPLLPYAGYLCWKLVYYGSLLPNSFYARSVSISHVSQGAVYLVLFALGCHAWLWAPLALAGAASSRSDRGQRRFATFLALALPTWTAYITWVGGDYLYPRFYVVLLPLLALGAERWAHGLRHRAGLPLAAGLVLAMSHGLPIVPRGGELLGVSNDRGSPDYRWRQMLQPDRFLAGRATWAFQGLVDRGLMPPVEGTGGFSYATRLPVVEPCALFDPTRARATLTARGFVGHEKCMDREELLAEGVALSFVRSVYGMGPSELVPRDQVGAIDRFCDRTTCIHLVAWDAELMASLRAVPGLDYVDFPPWLDRYVAGMGQLSVKQAQQDLAFFDEYYFRFNDDPQRRDALRVGLLGIDP